eukprot:scaffold156381_cov52-Prasinocladus_malaysianus.AAC.2
MVLQLACLAVWASEVQFTAPAGFSESEDVCREYPDLPEGPAPGTRVPGFLIVGAQKAGTTYLHRVLSEVRLVSRLFQTLTSITVKFLL